MTLLDSPKGVAVSEEVCITAARHLEKSFFEKKMSFGKEGWRGSGGHCDECDRTGK